MMGGRAAEIVVFGEPTSGPLLDLANATSLAYAAVARAGLAGSLIVMPDALALAQSDVRHRVEDLLAKAMDRATQIVSTHRAALDALAQALSEMRYLDGDEIRAVVQHRRRTVQAPRHRKGAINHEGRRS
jgi:cell division protease FtsH